MKRIALYASITTAALGWLVLVGNTDTPTVPKPQATIAESVPLNPVFEVAGAGVGAGIKAANDQKVFDVLGAGIKTAFSIFGTKQADPDPEPAPQPGTCGDAIDGRRVQLVQVTQPDAAPVDPALIVKVAHDVDNIFNQSALRDKTYASGLRVRWVANPETCQPAVMQIRSNAHYTRESRNEPFDNASAQGLNDPNRIYILFHSDKIRVSWGMWSDDDRADPAVNTNNFGTKYTFVSGDMVDAHTVAHELVHNLGGAQRSAPHGTSYGHVTDGYDLMAYNDGSPEAANYTTSRCGSASFNLLDCGSDDYFNASGNVPDGTYLCNHWNIWNASALDKVAPRAKA